MKARPISLWHRKADQCFITKMVSISKQNFRIQEYKKEVLKSEPPKLLNKKSIIKHRSLIAQASCLCKRGILPELLISKSSISAKHVFIIHFIECFVYKYIALK